MTIIGFLRKLGLTAIRVCLVLVTMTCGLGFAQSWTGVNNGLADPDVWVLAVDPVSNSTLYAGGPSGVFKSTDAGANWSSTGLVLTPETITGLPGRPTPLEASSVVARLAVDSATPGTVYAGTIRSYACAFSQRRVFKTTDGGATWTSSLSPNINGCDNIKSLVLAPSDPGTLYLANHDENNGDTWSPIVKSTDGGVSWKYLGYPAVAALAVDPLDPSIVYAGTLDFVDPAQRGVLKSTDGGVTWTVVRAANSGISALTIDPKNRSAIYAAEFLSYTLPGGAQGFRGLLRSVDGGETWTANSNGLTHLIGTQSAVTALIVDRSDSSVLYLGTSGAGVFRSLDAGATWTSFNAGLTNPNVRSLALAGSGTLYAGTPAGVSKVAAQSAPLLSIEAAQFCTGSSWTVRLRQAPSSTSVRLLGVSNDRSWEISDWQRTDAAGRLDVAGTFSAGNEGTHSLRIEADGTLSNTIGFVVKRCDGELDAAFGTPGLVDDQVLTIQPDGKILSGNGLRPVRYNANGSLDSSFSVGGNVTLPFPGSATSDPTFTLFPTNLAVQLDGKIVAAGSAATRDDSYGGFLIRYNADGSPDLTFGNQGVALTDFSHGAIAITQDGKILSAGSTYAGGFSVARFDTNGSIDKSFGTGGIARAQFQLPVGADATRLAVQPDGKIVVGGAAYYPPGGTNKSDFVLARFNSDGSVDSTFGKAGIVTSDFSTNDHLCAMTLQPDGRIIIAGTVFLGYSDATWNDFLLARYNRDGSLDPAFGLEGRVTTDFSLSVLERQDDGACSVALQPDGRIVAGGTSATGFANDKNAYRYGGALASYNHDGSLDTTFGIAGKITTGSGISALGIQSDGKILTAGSGLRRYHNTLLPITSLTFDPPMVRPGGLFTATIWGADATDDTYFDLLFRSPGSLTEQVAENWQKGPRSQFASPMDMPPGTWLVTGVRAHRNLADHTAEFVPVWATLTVSETPQDEVRLSIDSTQYSSRSLWQLHVKSNAPNAPVDLLGTSRGVPWEVRDWRRTGSDGTLIEGGTFSRENEGVHQLRVRIGNWISNTILFTIWP